jgi:hypothetical protein
VHIEKSTEVVTLTLEAPGFQPRSVRVVPDRDHAIDVPLRPLPHPRTRKPAVSQDLENPF